MPKPETNYIKKVSTLLFKGRASDFGGYSRELLDHREMVNHQVYIVSSGSLAAGKYKVRFIPDEDSVVESTVDTGEVLDMTAKDSAYARFVGMLKGIHLEVDTAFSAGETISVVVSSYTKVYPSTQTYLSTQILDSQASDVGSFAATPGKHDNMLFHQLSLASSGVLAAGVYSVRLIPDVDEVLETSVDIEETLDITAGNSAYVQFDGVMKGVDLQVSTPLTGGETISVILSSSTEQFDTLILSAIGGTVGDHLLLSNIGSNTHVQIDSHIADGTIHFTEASIDHLNIQNIGSNSHAAIDTHLSNAPIHVDWAGASAGTIHTDNYIENVPTTLETGTVTATTYGITSDGGADDILLAEATTLLAGLMSAAKWNEVVANTAKVTNATHTGEVTGATALSLDVTAITNQPFVGFGTIGALDEIIVSNGGVLSSTNFTEMALFWGTYFNNYVHPNHSGQVTSVADGAQALTIAAITDQPASGALVASDTFLTNDGGVLSETTFTQLNAYLNAYFSPVGHTHGSYTNSLVYSGADVISSVPTTDGIVTGLSSRTLTLADLSVTASAAQVSLMNVTGATADRALITDGANFAAWQQIAHSILSGIGTNTHPQIDSHISDSTLHFTEGSIDHGSIGGLGDDDHTQYVLADGTRDITGNQSVDGNLYVGDTVLAPDNFFYLYGLDANTPAIVFDDADRLTYDRSTNEYSFVIGSLPQLTVTSTQVDLEGNDLVAAGDISGSGDLAMSGTLKNSPATGITAFAGGGQASATQLTKGWNEVNTVVTDGDSVKLPSAAVGLEVTVHNDSTGGKYLDLFPNNGDSIEDGSLNAAYAIPSNTTIRLYAWDVTNWKIASSHLFDDQVYIHGMSVQASNGIGCEDDVSDWYIGGGAGPPSGGTIHLYGPSHSTKPGYIEFEDSGDVLVWNGTDWDFQANDIITTGTINAGLKSVITSTDITTLGPALEISRSAGGATYTVDTANSILIASDDHFVGLQFIQDKVTSPPNTDIYFGDSVNNWKAGFTYENNTDLVNIWTGTNIVMTGYDSGTWTQAKALLGDWVGVNVKAEAATWSLRLAEILYPLHVFGESSSADIAWFQGQTGQHAYINVDCVVDKWCGLNVSGATASGGFYWGDGTNGNRVEMYTDGGWLDIHSLSSATPRDLKYTTSVGLELHYDDSLSLWDFQSNDLTCGLFTSAGIDDNCTGERLQVGDNTLSYTSTTTPTVSIKTSAGTSQDALLQLGGARTGSSSSDIAKIEFLNVANSRAEIVMYDPAGSSGANDGAFKFRTYDNNVALDALTFVADGKATFLDTVTAPAFVAPYAHYQVSTATDHGGANNTVVAAVWDGTELHEDSEFTHSTVTNPSRVTVGTTGRYHMKGVIACTSGATNRQSIASRYRIDGGTWVTLGAMVNYNRGSIYGAIMRIPFDFEADISASSYVEIGTNVEDTDASSTALATADSSFIIRRIG